MCLCATNLYVTFMYQFNKLEYSLHYTVASAKWQQKGKSIHAKASTMHFCYTNKRRKMKQKVMTTRASGSAHSSYTLSETEKPQPLELCTSTKSNRTTIL